MKNFSMPEQVSPTLETDELMRLKHSLEKNVSREVAESIIKEIPLSINSTPDIRAEWVEKLSAVLGVAEFSCKHSKSADLWDFIKKIYTEILTLPIVEKLL